MTLLRAREGAAALLRGQYDKAVTAYDEALTNPEIADFVKASIYSDRGVAKWRLKQTKEAIDDFNLSIQLSPENASVYNNRGNALVDLGHPEEAVKDFDRAIALSPNYGAAYNNRGNARTCSPLISPPSRTSAKRSSSCRPAPSPSTAAARRMPRCSAITRRCATTPRLCSLNAKYDAAFENRGEANLALEQYAEAAEDFSQSLAIKPDQPQLVLLLRARLCRRQEVQHRARGPQQGDRAPAGLCRGLYRARRALHASERYDDAIADLTRAIELSPQNARPMPCARRRGSSARRRSRRSRPVSTIAKQTEAQQNETVAAKGSETPADPNAPAPFDPNAMAPIDPAAMAPVDPNAVPADPNAPPADPNAVVPADPNAPPSRSERAGRRRSECSTSRSECAAGRASGRGRPAAGAGRRPPCRGHEGRAGRRRASADACPGRRHGAPHQGRYSQRGGRNAGCRDCRLPARADERPLPGREP